MAYVIPHGFDFKWLILRYLFLRLTFPFDAMLMRVIYDLNVVNNYIDSR